MKTVYPLNGNVRRLYLFQATTLPKLLYAAVMSRQKEVMSGQKVMLRQLQQV